MKMIKISILVNMFCVKLLIFVLDEKDELFYMCSVLSEMH